MKIRIVKIPTGYKIVHNKKLLNVGEEIDIPKERAESFIAREIAEEIKSPKKTKNENKE